MELTTYSKMITVALAQGNSTSAREAYYQMSESGKSAAVTKYLMYKIALREGDEALGMLSPPEDSQS